MPNPALTPANHLADVRHLQKVVSQRVWTTILMLSVTVCVSLAACLTERLELHFFGWTTLVDTRLQCRTTSRRCVQCVARKALGKIECTLFVLGNTAPGNGTYPSGLGQCPINVKQTNCILIAGHGCGCVFFFLTCRKFNFMEFADVETSLYPIIGASAPTRAFRCRVHLVSTIKINRLVSNPFTKGN